MVELEFLIHLFSEHILNLVVFIKIWQQQLINAIVITKSLKFVCYSGTFFSMFLTYIHLIKSGKHFYRTDATIVANCVYHINLRVKVINISIIQSEFFLSLNEKLGKKIIENFNKKSE